MSVDGICHSEQSEESALAVIIVWDDDSKYRLPEAAAEQIPHRFRFGKPQRKGFGMARSFDRAIATERESMSEAESRFLAPLGMTKR